MIQTPRVGQSVIYYLRGSADGVYRPEVRAAIITEVVDPYRSDKPPDMVGLCVFNPEGLFFPRDVLYSPDPYPGRWSWPPEEEEVL